LHRLQQWPASLAFTATNLPVVRPLMGRRYQRDLDAHKPRLPTLGESDASIVDGLHRFGVHVTSLSALGLDQSDEMVTAARDRSDRYAAEARRRNAGGEQHLIVPVEETTRFELFTWGLQDRLLDIVERYLGLPVAYDGPTIIYTVADGREGATRLWHRDREDRRMLKVAVYLNDVGNDGGPFQLFSRVDERQDDRHGYRYHEADDTHFREWFGEDYARSVTSCTGPAGTVVFADTAKYFHRGAPAFAQDRAAAFFSYFARRPRHPFFCARSGLSRDQLATIADGLPSRQREAVLWHRSLPLPMRMIPAARI
jgi:hypothetical protein